MVHWLSAARWADLHSVMAHTSLEGRLGQRRIATEAEALIVTAVGSTVTIPAVAVFNYFQGRLSAALADAQTLGHVVLAPIERHDPGSSDGYQGQVGR